MQYVSTIKAKLKKDRESEQIYYGQCYPFTRSRSLVGRYRNNSILMPPLFLFLYRRFRAHKKLMPPKKKQNRLKKKKQVETKKIASLRAEIW